jgi:hypothetical protein
MGLNTAAQSEIPAFTTIVERTLVNATTSTLQVKGRGPEGLNLPRARFQPKLGGIAD